MNLSLSPSPSTAEISRVEDAGDFAAFAFPQRRARVQALAPPWLAIGARWRGVPAGLALALVEHGRVWLDSVMVAAPLRRKGIGTALLAALADEARAAGAERIDAQYSGFLPRRDAFEALLARSGWRDPTLLDIQLVGHAGAMAEIGGAWRPVQRAMRDLPEHSAEAFVLRDGDDARIDALLAAAPELGVPDPRQNAALDSELSTALRHRGTLVGWIAAQRLTWSQGHGTLDADAPSILYSGARLADGHHKAFMLVGYHRAFSRQAQLYGPASRAVYRTHPAAAAMYTFTRERFASMALHVEERFGTSLPLISDIARQPSSQEYSEC